MGRAGEGDEMRGTSDETGGARGAGRAFTPPAEPSLRWSTRGPACRARGAGARPSAGGAPRPAPSPEMAVWPACAGGLLLRRTALRSRGSGLPSASFVIQPMPAVHAFQVLLI